MGLDCSGSGINLNPDRVAAGSDLRCRGTGRAEKGVRQRSEFVKHRVVGRVGSCSRKERSTQIMLVAGGGANRSRRRG